MSEVSISLAREAMPLPFRFQLSISVLTFIIAGTSYLCVETMRPAFTQLLSSSCSFFFFSFSEVLQDSVTTVRLYKNPVGYQLSLFFFFSKRVAFALTFIVFRLLTFFLFSIRLFTCVFVCACCYFGDGILLLPTHLAKALSLCCCGVFLAVKIAEGSLCCCC